MPIDRDDDGDGLLDDEYVCIVGFLDDDIDRSCVPSGGANIRDEHNESVAITGSRTGTVETYRISSCLIDRVGNIRFTRVGLDTHVVAFNPVDFVIGDVRDDVYTAGLCCCVA
jgi:hypothetical protein